VFVDSRIDGGTITTQRYPIAIQTAFSLAFGRYRQSEDVGHTVMKAFGHEVSNHRAERTEDKSGATEFPNWYRGGLSHPTREYTRE